MLNPKWKFIKSIGFPAYNKLIIEKITNNKDWADKIISGLAKNWDIKRIAELDLIILRMAMVELKLMPDIPEKVVLNEAIELAKKYSTEESPSFVNGILDNFLKNIDNF